MSNGANIRTLTYDIADLPMLLHALRIGASTAMLCGHKGAQARMKQYVAVLKEAQLPGMELFDEEIFAELGAALAMAHGFEVIVEDPGWTQGHWRTEHSVAVRVLDAAGDARTYFTEFRHQAAGEKLAANVERVRSLMAELAPLGVTEATCPA